MKKTKGERSLLSQKRQNPVIFDKMHVAEKYAREVVSGEVERCEWATLACQRFLKDLKNPLYYFDVGLADRAIGFIESLKHYKGEFAKKPIRLVDDQKFVIANLFGLIRKIDGTRKYRYCYWEVPRKYGKTLLIAAIGIYLMYGDKEYGAEIYCIATKMDVSARMFDDARILIRRSGDDDFIEAFHITNSPRKITDYQSDSYMVPLGKDKDGQTSDGLNPHGILWDEVHALKDYSYFTVMNSATGARKQPLFLMITTSGRSLLTVGRDQHKYVRKILKGNDEGRGEDYFGIIHTIDQTDIDEGRFDDPKVWKKCHPLYGITVNEEKYQSQYELAQSNPQIMREFKTKWLNMWTNEASIWLDSEAWVACGSKKLDRKGLIGKRCYGGLDLSIRGDLSAFVLIFPPQEGINTYVLLPLFWCPSDDVEERSSKTNIPYFDWVKNGDMNPIPGKVFDDKIILRDIKDFIEPYNCIFIGYDRTYSHSLVNSFEDEVCEMLEFHQGWLYISPPSQEFERLVKNREILHPDNPVMNWNVGNAVVKEDEHLNIKVDKKRSEEKVDGVVAAIMALGVCMNQEEEGQDFIIETW